VANNGRESIAVLVGHPLTDAMVQYKSISATGGCSLFRDIRMTYPRKMRCWVMEGVKAQLTSSSVSRVHWLSNVNIPALA